MVSLMEAMPQPSDWNHIKNGDSDHCVATTTDSSPTRVLEFDGIVKCLYPRSDITVSIRKADVGGDHGKYPGSLIEEQRHHSLENCDETSLGRDEDSGRHSDGISTGYGENTEELTSYGVESDEFGESRLLSGDESRSIGFDSIQLDDSARDACQSMDSDQESLEDEVGFSRSHTRRGRLRTMDWISEQQEMNKDALVYYKVGAKSKHVVHFNVKKGDVVVWEFGTYKRDIAFGVLFESTAVEELPGNSTPIVEESEDECNCSPVDPKPHPVATAQDNLFPILPEFSVNSHISPIMGSHSAITDGIYVITFDNSYSKFFSKDLYYRISTQKSLNDSLSVESQDLHASEEPSQE